MAVVGVAQFGPFQEAVLENLTVLGQSLAGQVEKFTRLQLDSGLESTREALTASQALLEVKDAEGLAKWQEAHIQPNLDRASENARQQYEVLVETRGILADALKQSTAEATRQIQSGIDDIAGQAPEGFEFIFDAIRKGLDAQLAALENVTKVSDQIEANVFALKNVVKPVVKSGGNAKRKAA